VCVAVCVADVAVCVAMFSSEGDMWYTPVIVMCYSVLQHVLQRVLQHVLQWNSVCCSAFQCVAVKDTQVCTPVMVVFCSVL